MCFDIGSRHLGCWGQNTSRIQHEEVLTHLNYGSFFCQAIRVVGRLTNLNPAYVMPTLRKLLSQLLNDLSFGADVTNAESSAELLAELIKAAPRVVHPYVEAIVHVLKPKLHCSTPAISSRALIAVGELGQVAGSAIDDHIPGFITVILQILKDQLSQSNRENAVRVLGQLCQSAGYVVQPYDDYPGLMTTLFTMLSEGKSASLRRETVRVLGILGALDPWREKMNRIKFESEDPTNVPSLEEKEKEGEHKTDAATHKSVSGVTKFVQMTQHPVGTEDFYQELVVNELLAIAYEPSLSHIHDKVIRSYAIMVVKSGLKFVPYLPKMIAASLHIIRASDDSNRHLLFNGLGKIVKIFGPHMRSYLRDIIDLVVDYWLNAQKGNGSTAVRFEPHPGMHTAVMGLLRASVQSLGGEFKMYLPSFLKHSMIVLSEDNTSDRRPTLQVFEAFCVLGGLLDDWLPSVVSVIIDIINADAQTPVTVRKTAIETLTKIAKQADIGTQSSSIVHTLTSAIDIVELQSAVFSLLVVIMATMGRDYVSMGHLWMVEQMLVEKNVVDVDARYRSFADQLANGDEIADTLDLLDYEQPLQFKMIEQGPNTTHANRATQKGLIRLAEEACVRRLCSNILPFSTTLSVL